MNPEPIHILFMFPLPSEMEMANPAYLPPNQTAPWPDRMMMDHYGNQSRYDISFILKHKKRISQ